MSVKRTNRLHSHLTDKEIENIIDYFTGEANLNVNQTIRHINSLLMNKGDNFTVSYRGFMSWLQEEKYLIYEHYKKVMSFRNANSALNQRALAEKKETKLAQYYESEEKPKSIEPHSPWTNPDGTIRDLDEDLSPEELRARRAKRRHGCLQEPRESDFLI